MLCVTKAEIKTEAADLLQSEWQLSRTQTTIRVGEDVGEKAHLYIDGGTANWCSQSGKQHVESLENLEWNHNWTQQSHSSIYTQKT